MNTTARIEATGAKNRIHISEETAQRLISCGKEHWVQMRDDKIHAKGKGELTTYWLNLGAATTASISRSERSDGSPYIGKGNADTTTADRKTSSMNMSESQSRIVEWNVDLLQRQLKMLIAHRQAKRTPSDNDEAIKSLEADLTHPGRSPLEEVIDVITLPKYDASAVSVDHMSITISEKVLSQLRDFVKTIACMYRGHPFHNYEHAR